MGRTKHGVGWWLCHSGPGQGCSQHVLWLNYQSSFPMDPVAFPQRGGVGRALGSNMRKGSRKQRSSRSSRWTKRPMTIREFGEPTVTSDALARARCSSYPVGDCDLHAWQMDLLATFSALPALYQYRLMGDGRRAGLWRGSFEIRPAGRVAKRFHLCSGLHVVVTCNYQSPFFWPVANRFLASDCGHRTAAGASSLRVPAPGPSGRRPPPTRRCAVLSAQRNDRNEAIQGQITWIYSAGQGTDQADQAVPRYAKLDSPRSPERRAPRTWDGQGWSGAQPQWRGKAFPPKSNSNCRPRTSAPRSPTDASTRLAACGVLSHTRFTWCWRSQP